MHIETIEIPGIITPGSGIGVASKTLAMQIPLFPTHIQEALKDTHRGTLNVDLQVPLIIPTDKYDMDTGPVRIKWTNDWVAERFYFKQCELLIDGSVYRAWIYKPTSSPNSVHPFRVEVITGYIIAREHVNIVTLRLKNAKVVTAVTL